MRKVAFIISLLLIVSVFVLAINISKLKKVADIAKKGAAASREINEEEEYYIGRAVGATILARYKLFKNETITRYLNQVGTYLALRSDRPQTFIGYRFALLDTTEVNAFAAPSGIIFVTRGLLLTCEDEDELAAAIAHEVEHIVSRDPTQAIKSERMKSFASYTASELTSGSTKVVQLFKDTVADISNTLLQKGYSRTQEKEADLAAVKLLKKCGYNDSALVSLLKKLKAEEVKKAKIYSAHPSCDNRLNYLQPVVSEFRGDNFYNIRKERFLKMKKLCQN